MQKHLLLPLASIMASASIAQNVGIGTSSPTRAKLEVVGVAGKGSTNAVFGGNSTGISLQQNWPTLGFNQYRDNTVGNGKYMSDGYAAIQYFDPNTGAMQYDVFNKGTASTLTDNGTRAMQVLRNGNVGIKGNAFASASLFVPKAGNADGSAVFAGTTYWSHFNYGFFENTYIRAGADGGNVYINDIIGGKVIVGRQAGLTKFGINSGDPMYTLEVVQSNNKGMVLINPDWGWKAWELRSDQFNSDANKPKTSLSLYYNGRQNPIMGWFDPDDGSYFGNSDMRMKTAIQAVGPVLQKVMQLQPMHYKWIGSTNDSYSIGLLAQEVRRYFPEMVSEHENSEKDGGLPHQLGLNYAALSVIAIKAIQEQQQEIAALSAANTELQKQLQAMAAVQQQNRELNTRLAKLEKLLSVKQ